MKDREGYIDKVFTNIKLHCHDCYNCLVINILTKHWSDVLSSLSYMLNWLTVMDIDWMPPSGIGTVLCLVLLEVDNNNNKSSVGTNLYPLTTNLYPLTTNWWFVKLSLTDKVNISIFFSLFNLFHMYCQVYYI